MFSQHASRRAQLRFAAALAAAWLISPVPASASADERVERDIGNDHFAAGGTLVLNQPVSGDLVATGGNLDVNGAVGGDALVAGGTLRLNAPVGGNLYAAGGRMSVSAAVTGNARLAGGDVELRPESRVDGNLSIGGGQIRIDGAIKGYLQAGGGRVYVNGPVDGDVEVAGGRVELGPNARIGGKLRYRSDEELVRDPAATVQGGIERLSFRHLNGGKTSDGRAAGAAGFGLWTLGLMALAALLAGALPLQYRRISETWRTRLPFSLLLGFIALVCVPAAAVLLLVTIIGIPIALAVLLAYGGLLLIGYVTSGVAVGDWALARYGGTRGAQTGWRVAAAALGVLVVALLSCIPLLGGLIALVALLAGMGALLSQFKRVGAGPPAAASP